MSENEVEELIQASSIRDLCGRRPWTNVENHDKDYPQGDLQGFSGLPYGPRPDVSPVIRKKKRVVNGGFANYGEWPWQVSISIKAVDGAYSCGGVIVNNSGSKIKKR